MYLEKTSKFCAVSLSHCEGPSVLLRVQEHLQHIGSRGRAKFSSKYSIYRRHSFAAAGNSRCGCGIFTSGFSACQRLCSTRVTSPQNFFTFSFVSCMKTFTSSDGLKIRVGENAAENQRLCKEARQNDLWFHLDGQSSPHAVLQVATGKKANASTMRSSIHECQQLVKHFSSAK